MGLLECPASFQRLVELALVNVIVYIDDLPIHSKNHAEHHKQMEKLFCRLRNTGLKAKISECEFGSNNVSYLGYRLTPLGILQGADKLKAVRNSKPPKNLHEVRQFMGLCNFFRSHVRNFAQIGSPLHKLTSIETKWKGGELPEECLLALNQLKMALSSEPIVANPRKNLPYSLIVDAATGNDKNEGGLGAVCQTDQKGVNKVIAYASRQLLKHEKNYIPFQIEMLAIVWAIELFDTYLRGRTFVVCSDHKPLEAHTKRHEKTLSRLQEAYSRWNFNIVHKKGSEMPSDYLSRNVVEAKRMSDEEIAKQMALNNK